MPAGGFDVAGHAEQDCRYLIARAGHRTHLERRTARLGDAQVLVEASIVSIIWLRPSVTSRQAAKERATAAVVAHQR